MDNIKHHIETEQKIIHLLLKNRKAIEDLIESGISDQFFDPCHQPIVSNVFNEFMAGDRLLTTDSYRHALVETGHREDLSVHMEIFAKCDIKAYAVLDDLGYLKRELVDAYSSRTTTRLLNEYQKETQKNGYYVAARNLVDNLNQSLVIAEAKKTEFAAIEDMRDEYVKYIKDRKENPEKRITCDIPEIDDVINVGFKPQHLTLFVADVGNFKTSLMLNIALNIWKKGFSVLFIPLEMNRFDLMDRIVSNTTKIPFSRLVRPEHLSVEEVQQIEGAKIWKLGKPGNQFCILDADERTSVSNLQHEIQKRAFIFKPHVVVVDYIANLKPDIRFGQRNDLEIGEILKTLRFLGKRYEFHIISAAQLGRAAIRAIKEGKSNPDSSSIRGSHEYSADSDSIFILGKSKHGETDIIDLYALKARHGPSGHTQQLRVDPTRFIITSCKKTIGLTDPVEIGMELNRPQEEIERSIELPSLDFAGSIDLDDEFMKIGV